MQLDDREASAAPLGGTGSPEEELRALALVGIRKRREFAAHLLAYIAVNASLITIWAMTGSGFFWPVFPLLGWGIGVFFHAWDTFSAPITEARIDREVDRLRRRGRSPAADDP